MPKRDYPVPPLVIALLVLTIPPLAAQTPDRPQGTFEDRFPPSSAPQGTPAPRSGEQGGSEQKGPATVIKELIVPPAEAEPSRAPAAQQSAHVPAKHEAVLPVPDKRPLIAAPVGGNKATTGREAAGRRIATGRASWYGHSGRTASGEKFEPDGLTAAHKSLPLGTRLRVVNLRNQRSVVVRVNDRAPPKMKFVIDLSRGSARAIGIADVGPVAVYKLD
jgi:rare lipoprotein A